MNNRSYETTAIRVRRGIRTTAIITAMSAAQPSSAQVAVQLTNTCFYLNGPKAGSAENFPTAPPIPLGFPCNDGVASTGLGIIAGTPLAGSCHYTAGPKAGTYERLLGPTPQPVGFLCRDAAWSTGIVATPPPIPVPTVPTPNPPQPSAGTPVLRPPVSGHWRVVQGPSCPNPLNSHCAAPSNVFALDLVPVTGTCLGQPVLAPSDGTIVQLLNGIPNGSPGNHPAGNHLVIERSASEYIVIAHFSPNTFTVTLGATVTAGQVLGSCGDNGHSSGPHIHVHMQATPNILNYNAPPLPMVFTQAQVFDGFQCMGQTHYSATMNDILCQ